MSSKVEDQLWHDPPNTLMTCLQIPNVIIGSHYLFLFNLDELEEEPELTLLVLERLLEHAQQSSGICLGMLCCMHS